MKKSLILLAILSFLLPSVLYAADNVETAVIEEMEIQIDENTKQVSNKYFDLILEKKSQSPFGNYVPFILTVVPHLNSSKTQILWNTPSTLEATPKHNEFVNLLDGQTYTFKANIKPLKEGTYDFTVSVMSWQYDTNYTNSIDNTLTFDQNLVLQPVSQYYQILNVMKFIVILLVFIILCILTVVLVKKYMIKTKKWLTLPY